MSAAPAAVATSGVLHAVEHLSTGVVEFLAQATRELLQGGVRQTVVYASHGCAPRRDMPARFDPRVRLVPIERPSGRWHWAFARALRDELTARPYDAVHLHAGKAGFVGRLALGSLPSHPPVYYTPHGLTGVPGHHDLVSHELTGLLGADVSALAEHVKRLLDQPARAHELGDCARREARQRFHPQRFRRALLALYRLDVERLPPPPYEAGRAA